MILFSKDNTGRIRQWTITIEENGLLIRHGIFGGAMQEKFEEIPVGKAGRTKEQQIRLQYYSRINKQKDRGYVEDLRIANEVRGNSLGLARPMLAQKYEDVNIDFSRGVFVQRKYDGNRCIITNQGGKLLAYSRNGKLINTISHITDGLKLQPGMSIDGELYAHGYKLQEIVSWIKREQEDTLKLKFHAYDTMSSAPFEERFRQLSKIEGNIEIVPTWAVSSREAMFEYHTLFREEGYEGTIVRVGTTGYEDGKRSKSLIKVKEWNDEEFLVVDVVPSKDGWGILICEQPNGPSFRVLAPGTHEDKAWALTNQDTLKGRYINVEFAYRTEDGVPFHPVAKYWR